MTSLRGLHLAPTDPDACPVKERVRTLEAGMDAIKDEVHVLRAAVEALTIDVKAILERDDAFRAEMGLQLKRYAEHTDRNIAVERMFAATNKRLELLVKALAVNTKNIATEKRIRKGGKS